MKEMFSLDLSTKIYFGTNVLEEALEKEQNRLECRILVVTTGRSLIRCGHLERLQKKLVEIAGEENLFVYDKISQNPQLEEIEQAVVFGKENAVECVIGFGGGSALDAAKAVAIGIPINEKLEEYLLEGKVPGEETLPIISIPTTAGTGSELSKAAIISSSKHKIKSGIRGKNILPKVAIVDDVFTWTISKKVTLETGFDVLAHAIETYVAVKANIFSEMLCERAIRIVGENLPLLSEDLQNKNARYQLCFSSTMMGINLANVGTCFPHRMQYAIGAYTDTSHGAGLLAIYPKWIRYEYVVNQEKINNVLYWLGEGRADTAEQAEESFRRFLKRLDVFYSLSDLGINSNMVELLYSKVAGNLANDKLADKPQIIKNIFAESI